MTPRNVEEIDVALRLELLLVYVASCAYIKDEECRVVEVGEEHSPGANPKSVGVRGSALQAANVALVRTREQLDRASDPVSGRPIEPRHGLESSLRPANLSAHPA